MSANWLIPLIGMLAADLACETPLCSCMGPTHAREALARSHAVFLGRATAVRDTTLMVPEFGPWRQRIYTFQVLSSWKGVTTDSIDVLTRFDEGECGIEFRIGA